MIVVCGEALIDVFASPGGPAGLTLEGRNGGSPYNVAVGLARLNQRVAFLGSISRGFLGEQLMGSLVAEGVETAFVQRNDALTTLGLVGLDAAGTPSYAFYGHDGADRLLTPDALQSLPADIRAIQVGSFSMAVEPIASTLHALVERERGRRLIAYDPNVRLNVEPDVGKWKALLDRLLGCSDLVKISEEDLGLLRPGGRPEAFAAEALARGVELVVVTRAAQGAQAWTRAANASVPAAAAAVIDTVGAGDSFTAALLAWLAEHDALAGVALAALTADALQSALRFASRAAAITCSRRGADLPRRGEIADADADSDSNSDAQ